MEYQQHSLWISANAGSGKTSTLTERVVALMLRGAEPERICCLTYTKAAAGEMRTRVLSFLRDRLLLASPQLRRATIERLCECPMDAQLEQRACDLFTRVLDSPTGGPQLTTIHGFCQSILQRFPLEAGISPHFTVLDEAQAANLQRRARHRVLTSDGTDDAELREALQLIGSRMGEQRFSQWTQAITAHAADWAGLWRQQTSELLRQRLARLHGVEGQTRAERDAAFDGSITNDEVAMLRLQLPRLMEVKPKEAATLARWLETPASQRAPLRDDFVQIFLTRDGTRRKKLLPVSYPPEAPLRIWMEQMAERVLAWQGATAKLACAEESFAMAVLARRLLDHYAWIKAESMALDYDDLIDHTRQLLSHPGMLGWVMEKLDHRIDHLLIDEAQDTSAAQWNIARHLVEELLAGGAKPGATGPARSLLVVGDEKQSIYSFQGAAPDLFASEKSYFMQLLSGHDAPLRERQLDISYRSTASVLRLVDAVAVLPQVAAALSRDAAPTQHRLHRIAAPGRVVLHPPIAAVAKEALPPLVMPTHYPARLSAACAMAEAMARQVRALLDAGHTPDEILILVHKRRPLMLPLLRALERHQVPVAGLDRLVLADHLAVSDLLALMRWCTNTADDLALAQVLRSPLVGLDDDQLRALAHGRTGSLWQQCDHPQLARWLERRHLAPYAFLTELLEVDGLRAKFATRFGREVQEVLDELKMQAAMLPANVLPTLAHFVDFIGVSRRVIKREADLADGRVRVMTIHGAKGLEAPIVLLADMASPPTTARELVFFTDPAAGSPLPLLSLSDEARAAPALLSAKETKKQALLAEYQRLLYVALTRARDQLHVFGMAGVKTPFKAESWAEHVRVGLLHCGAELLDEGLLLADDTAMLMQADPRPRTQHEPLPGWLNAPAPEFPILNVVSAPSRLVQEQNASEYVAGGSDARARGVRLHRVLQWLAGDATAPIATLIARACPDWSADERAAAAREIEALQAAHGWLWQSPGRAEVTVAGSFIVDGTRLYARGQIDWLLTTPQGYVVLDYKTGTQVPASPTQVPAGYLAQLKIYRALVAELEPKRPVRTAILWTHTAQLMWLDDELDTAPWHYQNVMETTAVAA